MARFMNPNTHMKRFSGFTVIELITSMAVIGVLISLTVPALQSARSSAMDLVCQSNLRQMYVGWSVVLIDTNHIIPVTIKTSDSNHWTQLLKRAVPDVSSLPRSKQSAKRSNMCPTIYTKYGGVNYPNPNWGYALNTLWEAPNTTNEYKNWDMIRRPASYPWFTDPGIFFNKPGKPSAYHNVPDEDDSDHTWGVGIHHGSQTTANVAFADGSVRFVLPDAIDSKAWFENR